jgi:hypothetical protein
MPALRICSLAVGIFGLPIQHLVTVSIRQPSYSYLKGLVAGIPDDQTSRCSELRSASIPHYRQHTHWMYLPSPSGWGTVFGSVTARFWPLKDLALEPLFELDMVLKVRFGIDLGAAMGCGRIAVAICLLKV